MNQDADVSSECYYGNYIITAHNVLMVFSIAIDQCFNDIKFNLLFFL